MHGIRDDVVPSADAEARFASSPDAALELVDDGHSLVTTVGPLLERAVRWGLGERPVGSPVAGFCVRPERVSDAAAVRRVHTEAFEGPVEARIVDRLRGSEEVLVPLVAVDASGEVVGHVLFVRCHVGGAPIAGLAPLAVRPDCHGRGLGAWLAAAGLDAVRARGERACVVLGDPDYYGRLGFEPAVAHGIGSEYEVPQPVFRVIALALAGLAGLAGVARYPAAFGAAGA